MTRSLAQWQDRGRGAGADVVRARAMCENGGEFFFEGPHSRVKSPPQIGAGLPGPGRVGLEDLGAVIRLLRDEHDLTVVLIEHDMGMVMSISDHIVVPGATCPPTTTARRCHLAAALTWAPTGTAGTAATCRPSPSSSTASITTGR